MQIRFIVLVSLACLIGSAFGATTKSEATPTTVSSAKPKGFESRSIEETDDEFETQAQTHLGYRQQQRPLYDYSQSEEDQEEPPRQVYQSRNNYRQQQQQQNQQSNFVKQQQKTSSSEEDTEEEQEEPDRLSLLLAKSSFNCNSKNSGYYADESLNCEVFHYCQESQRHSWICPEGFTFHQIHLICMPPSHDNICQQSSKYHIVNDYLYKPINLQEHQSKPNVTLRYSDRYFPENYYENDRYSDEEEAPRQRVHHQQRQPIQIGFQQQAHSQPQPQHQPQPQAQPQPQYQRPVTQQIRQQSVQPAPTTPIYRKPIPTTTIQPHVSTLQHHLQTPQQHRVQTVTPSVTPTPYRFFSAAPQLQQHVQQHQQVYRTPEEINISLQQRRPQVFIATTPRYYEDEYLYERK